jgi:hypothetical protein
MPLAESALEHSSVVAPTCTDSVESFGLPSQLASRTSSAFEHCTKIRMVAMIARDRGALMLLFPPDKAC